MPMRSSRPHQPLAFALGLAFAMTAGTAAHGQARPADRGAIRAVRAAIDAANGRWQAAVRAGDAVGFAAEFADDAIFVVPMAAPARGRAAIEASTRAWLATVTVDSVILVRHDLTLTGDIAIEVGTVRTASTPRGGTTSTVAVASYLTAWQRQADGRWRIVRDMTTPGPRIP